MAATPLPSSSVPWAVEMAMAGYADAEVLPEVKPLDAFQEWYGYTDNNDTTSAKTVTMYLPDRDPEPKDAQRK
eukprot:Skav236067  [mRNA]  locus=scaffold2211:58038:59917:- [translate_table: standard]